MRDKRSARFEGLVCRTDGASNDQKGLARGRARALVFKVSGVMF